jgi:hypothetical protein
MPRLSPLCFFDSDSDTFVADLMLICCWDGDIDTPTTRSGRHDDDSFQCRYEVCAFVPEFFALCFNCDDVVVGTRFDGDIGTYVARLYAIVVVLRCEVPVS